MKSEKRIAVKNVDEVKRVDIKKVAEELGGMVVDKIKGHSGFLNAMRTAVESIKVGELRSSWDKYFMRIAQVVATRGTCNRARVGCVLTKDKRIVATGYNGSISGEEHCDVVGHLIINDHCQRSIHAEINALLQCAKFGTPIDGGICYVTHFPCLGCFKALVQAGVKEIYYNVLYRPEDEDMKIIKMISAKKNIIIKRVK